MGIEMKRMGNITALKAMRISRSPLRGMRSSRWLSGPRALKGDVNTGLGFTRVFKMLVGRQDANACMASEALLDDVCYVTYDSGIYGKREVALLRSLMGWRSAFFLLVFPRMTATYSWTWRSVF